MIIKKFLTIKIKAKACKSKCKSKCMQAGSLRSQDVQASLHMLSLEATASRLHEKW
jgi:hypothetical protein